MDFEYWIGTAYDKVGDKEEFSAVEELFATEEDAQNWADTKNIEAEKYYRLGFFGALTIYRVEPGDEFSLVDTKFTMADAEKVANGSNFDVDSLLPPGFEDAILGTNSDTDEDGEAEEDENAVPLFGGPTPIPTPNGVPATNGSPLNSTLSRDDLMAKYSELNDQAVTVWVVQLREDTGSPEDFWTEDTWVFPTETDADLFIDAISALPDFFVNNTYRSERFLNKFEARGFNQSLQGQTKEEIMRRAGKSLVQQALEEIIGTPAVDKLN